MLPCLDRCAVVDLRTRTHLVARQEVYTLDGVTVHVSAVLTYRVVEARLAVTAVEDCHASTQLLATTVLRCSPPPSTLQERGQPTQPQRAAR